MSFDVKQEETVSCRCLKMKNHHSVVVEYYSGFISFEYSSVLNRPLFFLFFFFLLLFFSVSRFFRDKLFLGRGLLLQANTRDFPRCSCFHAIVILRKAFPDTFVLGHNLTLLWYKMKIVGPKFRNSCLVSSSGVM